MRTWKALEEDFRALRAHFDARLDHIHGFNGESWRVAGAGSPDDSRRFESLAAIAGSKVLDLPAAADWPEIIAERDPATRWYRCLQHLSGQYRVETLFSHQDEEGQTLGTSWLSRVDNIYAASATLCVTLESLTVAPRQRLEALCTVPRYAGPCQHWRAAQGFLAAPEPDLAQAVAEAIHSVEGLARIVLSDPKITLSDASKELRMKRGLHPALTNAIERVYGYASDVGGIRHGATAAVQVKPAEAHFAIDASEASLRLLLALDTSG